MEAGQRVFGQYVLQERLAPPGPVAEVWRAWTDRGETFALKFPGEAVQVTAAWRTELEAAVNTCGSLTDSAVVAPLRYLEEGPLVAVASNDVPYRSLAALRREQPDRAFASDDLHWLLHQLCRTLDRLAGHPGYPHGDLRPSNFVPAPWGEFRLLDYRVSALFRRAGDTTRLSAAQQKNFFSNRSPQLVGLQPPTPADDIYALGASLYELLTGEPPFYTGNILDDLQNERPTEMGRRRDELGHPHPELPTAWEETVAACLAKDPAQRPTNPSEILERLGIDPAARSPWHVPAPVAPPRPAPVRPPAPPPMPPIAPAAPVVPAAPVPAPVTINPVVQQPRRQSPRSRRRLGCGQSCLLLIALVVVVFNARRLLNGPFAAPPSAGRVEVSGTLADLQRAVDNAAAGDTVRIADGVYTGNLRLRSGVSLEGSARGKVIVRAGVAGRGGAVASGRGLRDVRLTGIDFEGPGRAGVDAGDVPVVDLHDSEVTLVSCRVLYGAHDGLAADGGTIRLRDCAFFSNGAEGLHLEGPFAGTLEVTGCEFRRNGSNGLLLVGPAAGWIAGNTFEGNVGCGFVLIGNRRTPGGTVPELANNKSRLNSQSGYYFGRGAGGRVGDNLAERNTQQGFVVSDQGTAPVLHRNTSTANGAYGYAFKNGATALPLGDNTASGNDLGNVSR